MFSILDENFVVAIPNENGNENEEPARKNQIMHQVYFQLDENLVSLVNLKLYLI